MWGDNIILWSPINEWRTLNKIALDSNKWMEINHVTLQYPLGGNNN